MFETVTVHGKMDGLLSKSEARKMSSAACFQKLDNDRESVKLTLTKNQNRIDELRNKKMLLYHINREMCSRVVCRKDYDCRAARLSGWFFNKAIRGQIWANEIRRRRMSNRIDSLKVKRERFKMEDIKCFMQECKALQRTG